MKALETEISFRNGYTASPRMIWNGGFWDGVADRSNGRGHRVLGVGERPLPAWSPFYCCGYEIGHRAASNGFRDSDSTEYWNELITITPVATFTNMIRGETRERGNDRS